MRGWAVGSEAGLLGVRLGERQAWGGCELPACGQLHCQTPEPGLRVGGWSAQGLWAAFI